MALLLGSATLSTARAAEADPAAFRPSAAELLDRLALGAERLASRAEVGGLEGAKRAWIGRDGRTASLREFTRNVIVNEFADTEPEPPILDALVAYMEQFEFLPDPTFVGLLDTTLDERDAGLTRLVVDTINRELREVGEHWYRPEDHEVRGVIAGWAVQLRRVDSQACRGAWDEAMDALQTYRAGLRQGCPRWSRPSRARSTIGTCSQGICASSTA